MGLYYPPLPFGFLASQIVSLVDGSDGDLVVLNGQTIGIPAGSIKSYNSIDIQAGGILEITGPEAITQIGCKGNFIVNGTFRGQTAENVALRSIGADNWTGNPYSYTPTQSNGGNGGSNNNGTGIGGAQALGHGGGGAGGTDNFNCAPNHGGNGISNGDSTTGYENDTGTACVTSIYTMAGGLANQGGHGSPGNYQAQTNSNNEALAFTLSPGGNGGGGGGGAAPVTHFVFKDQNDWFVGQSGAGGGARGEHGRSVFILAESGITGTGSINFSGNTGYNGGGITRAQNLSSGGGGGGAGGSGGSLWIKSSGGVLIPSTTVNGGAGGIRSPLSTIDPFGYTPLNCTSGSVGVAGILDVQAI